jgi:hypothetical protein
LIAGTASGCAGTAAAGTGSPAAPATAHSASAPAVAGAEPTPDRPTAKPVQGGRKATVAACRPADVAATITAQDHRSTATTRMAMITVTNTSRTACWVEGWTSVRLVNPAAEVVPVSTRQVEQPGPAQRITLRPGVGAPAGMKWTVCDKSDGNCHVGNSLQVGLPRAKTLAYATLEGFPAPERVEITMKSLQIGPLQLSRQGVVAW